MFRLGRRFASERDSNPYAAALEALDRRDFERAEREFTDLLATCDAPADRSFLLNKRGVARVGLGQVEPARDDFNAALACVPRYAPALTNLGNVLLEEGAIDSAIARYEQAIASDPQYAIAHLNLGTAYKRAGRFDEGVRALRAAQRLEKTRLRDAFGRRRS